MGRNKGFKYSEEHKQRLSEIHKKLFKNGYIHPMLGKHQSEETKGKISKANTGKIRSEESKRKTSLALKEIVVHSRFLKGCIPWHKGKRGVYSSETLQKMGVTNKGRTVSEETRLKISSKLKGRIVSEETRKKFSKIHKGKKVSEESKKKMSESGKNLSEEMKKHKLIGLKKYYAEHPEMLLNNRLRRNKITKPEKTMFEILEAVGLKENKHFEYNKMVKTQNGFKFPDFLVFPDKIIEVDGVYWHNKEKDDLRDKELIDSGYKVIHFTDKDLENSENVKPEVIEWIKQ